LFIGWTWLNHVENLFFDGSELVSRPALLCLYTTFETGSTREVDFQSHNKHTGHRHADHLWVPVNAAFSPLHNEARADRAFAFAASGNLWFESLLDTGRSVYPPRPKQFPFDCHSSLSNQQTRHKRRASGGQRRLHSTCTAGTSDPAPCKKKFFTSCDPHHDIYTFCYWQIFWHSI
jgi:hypothetical protein